MGTKIRVDKLLVDDIDEWDEDQEDNDPRRMKRGRNRWRDIEDKLEEKRLRSQIEDIPDYDLRF